MLKLIYRKVLLSSSGSFTLRRIFLAAIILYMLLFRLDPGWNTHVICTTHPSQRLLKPTLDKRLAVLFSAALPASFMWISKLAQLLKQMWRTMFAPYHQALAHSKGL